MCTPAKQRPAIGSPRLASVIFPTEVQLPSDPILYGISRYLRGRLVLPGSRSLARLSTRPQPIHSPFIMNLSQLLLLVPAVVLSVADVSVATPVPKGDGAAEPRSIVKRSFLETCIGNPNGPFTLSSGHVLNGKCLKTGAAWNWQATSQDLNLCITNSNGNLQWLSK